eukprot:gene713-19663_t
MPGVTYHIDMAEDGDEAVRSVYDGQHGDCPYTALLLDIHLPRMSGFDASRQIRILEQRESWLEIPIFGVTADPNK